MQTKGQKTMRDVTVAITEASYSGNKGAAAMLQSSIRQLHDRYGEALKVVERILLEKGEAELY